MKGSTFPHKTTNSFHPHNQYLTDELRHKIKAGDRFEAQAVVKDKNGVPFHIEVHASMFLYRRKLHMLSVVRDVTEQIQAQQLLERRVAERTQELSTLLEISHKVSSTIELRPLLGLVLEQLKQVVDYCCAMITLLQRDTLVIVENCGPRIMARKLQVVWPIEHIPTIWRQLCEPSPLIGVDLCGKDDHTQEVRAWLGNALAVPSYSALSWMIIPFTLKERPIGVLFLFFDASGYYTTRHAALATAIAQQTAVAIENAQLYARAQEVATLEERHRLARELHDSVSQALYGVSLGAHTARKQLESDPGKAREPLDYVLFQAEAALTEMRALVFELRPESLVNEGLIGMLKRQCSAVYARHGVTIVTQFEHEPELPLMVKQELYWLAQEALHNAVKHVKASRIVVAMWCDARGVMLEVTDDRQLQLAASRRSIRVDRYNQATHVCRKRAVPTLRPRKKVRPAG